MHEKNKENENPLMRHLKQILKDTDKEPLSMSEKGSIWQKIEWETKKPNQRSGWWLKIAASIILISGIIALIYTSGLTPEQNDSFREMAVLTNSPQVQKETSLKIGNSKVLEMSGSSEIIIGDDFLNVKTGAATQYEQSINNDVALNTLTVPYGRTSQITLEDGTKVWLNSGSSLVFPHRFAGKNREVYVYGEAYFDVMHNKDKPFYVHTSTMKVRVLGTSFNIKSYEDDKASQTVLVEGSVEITGYDKRKEEGKIYKLKPGQMADFSHSSSNITISKVNTALYSSWKEGYILAKNTSLAEILVRISRFYDTPLLLDSKQLDNETFSGRLDMKMDLISVLNVLSMSSTSKIINTERGIMIQK